MQCWCDVGRSSERQKSARLQVLLMNNFSALGSQFSHRPGHPTQQADYCANFGVRFSRVLAPSLASDLVPHAYCLHCPSLPRLEQPVVRRTVDFTAWRSVPDHPPRHLRASATSRRRRHAANPPRTPPRSLLSAGVCHCGRHPGAGWGGYRSLPFDSHRFPVGGSGHGRRRAEQLGGSGGSGGSGSSRGASRGGESGAAATASGRCESARVGRRSGHSCA
jgi:hypothetical protein